MARKDAVLPNLLLKNHRDVCLTYGKNTTQPYNDNLCPFCAVALHLQGRERLEEEPSELFILFINRMAGLSPPQIQGVQLNDIPVVEGLLLLSILLYEIDIVDGKSISELARRNVQKCKNTVRPLGYNNHTCYMSIIKVVFQPFRCLNFGTV